MEDGFTTAKSIWNFDEARMRNLNYKMLLCEDAFEKWDFNSMLTHLNSVKRIISGALSDKEWEDLERDFVDLEKLKRKAESSRTPANNIIELYNKGDKIYIKLNRLMQKHGFFFRKGDDVRFAALKR